ncbi:hypothetical protein [Cytobacillus stercorigallinarum]|nr:hypothetical protein [Cytobacillus stercorigallinarum]
MDKSGKSRSERRAMVVLAFSLVNFVSMRKFRLFALQLVTTLFHHSGDDH